MCLIVARDTTTPTAEGFPFSAAWDHNPDGFGIALADGKRLYVFKTRHRDRAERLLRDAMNGNRPFLAHFRFRTRGKRNIDNCHPFPIGRHHAVMAHNGTLETDEGPKGESDSHMFARGVLGPLADIGGINHLFDKRSKIGRMLEFMTQGSRIALLRSTGQITIYGKGWTSWRSLKCSNAYSLIPPTKYVTEGGGWCSPSGTLEPGPALAFQNPAPPETAEDIWQRYAVEAQADEAERRHQKAIKKWYVSKYRL